MQLKLTRSQRDGGVISKTVVFCLDARIQLTSEEQQNVSRYKLSREVIYNSEASKRHLERGAELNDGTATGALKSIARTAMAAMNLNITIESLQRGQHIECKSLDELLRAEDALMEACKNLRSYLEAAATFDGREVLIDFDSEEPTVKATAVPPSPMLVPPRTAASAPSATSERPSEPPSFEEPRPANSETAATQPVWGEAGTAYGSSAPSAATIAFDDLLSRVERWIHRSSAGEKWLVFGGGGAILFVLYLIF